MGSDSKIRLLGKINRRLAKKEPAMIARRQAQAARRAAFTLMEMLVVVAILVVLAGAAVPIYLNYLANARIDRAKTDVVALQTAVEAYTTQHGTPPASLEVLCEV